MLDQTNANLIGGPSVQRCNLAARHRAKPSTRRAHRDHSRSHQSGLGKRKGMQDRRGIDPQQGKVRGPVHGDHDPFANIAIGKGRLKGLRTANHMGSG